MMSKQFLILEMLILFIGIPLVFLFPILIEVKIVLFLFALIYLLVVAIKDKKKTAYKSKMCNQIKTYKSIVLRFFIIAVGTSTTLFFTNREDLFNVISTKPILWLKFSFIYIIVSVIPQELLYRSFFTKRYRLLFTNKNFFILTNAILFSLGHIWFRSATVLIFTFIGGVLFAKTYQKSNSIYTVVTEHALYGVWLYTIGYGALFMFPVQ